MNRLWTPEIVAWLKENFAGRSVRATVQAMNEHFGTSIKPSQLRNSQTRLGLKGAWRNTWETRPEQIIWTPERIAWLQENYPRMTVTDCVKAINLRFGVAFKPMQLRNAKKRFGVANSLFDGSFRKGFDERKYIPQKGVSQPGSEKTQFKKGHKFEFNPGHVSPMWTERVNNGEWQIKIPEPSPHPAHVNAGWGKDGHWVSLARWRWREKHGEIPEGHVVLHLDGDRLNCDLQNPGLRAARRAGSAEWQSGRARLRLARDQPRASAPGPTQDSDRAAPGRVDVSSHPCGRKMSKRRSKRNGGAGMKPNSIHARDSSGAGAVPQGQTQRQERRDMNDRIVSEEAIELIKRARAESSHKIRTDLGDDVWLRMIGEGVGGLSAAYNTSTGTRSDACRTQRELLKIATVIVIWLEHMERQ